VSWFFIALVTGVAFVALGFVLLVIDSIRRRWDVRQARREAARQDALRKHPAQRRPLRRQKALGGRHDGEPLSDDELNEYTAIMMTNFPPIGSTQARETSADEDAE
jgi:hypothetical protein